MIQANELRIGNWVIAHDGKPHKVNPLSIVGQSQFDIVKAKGYEPIPLSEEILLKCGFDVKDGRFGDEYHLSGFSIYTSEKNTFCYCWDEFIKDIQHLHQLQNLYFALTDKELNIE